MKILITGICGFVGKILAETLQETVSDVKITGLDNLSRPGSETNRTHLLGRGVRVLHGDVRLASDLEALGKMDWVIDAAANPSVQAGVDGRSSSRQVVEHNLLGTVNLLEYCRSSAAGLILLSTSRVYSVQALASLPLKREGERFALDESKPHVAGVSPRGIREDFSTVPPISLYGSTKLASECLALEYGETFSFPVWINRCGVMAGPGQFGTAEQGIFSYWVHAWRARRPLRYLGFEGSGCQLRDALHPADLAPLLVRQMSEPSAPAPRLLNLGGGPGNAMSLAELSAWCGQRFGPHSVVADGRPRRFDIPWVVMDSGCAERHWNWKPRWKIASVLEEIALHAERHTAWLDLMGA
jgi:CDP-paratose 2-epimerase